MTEYLSRYEKVRRSIRGRLLEPTPCLLQLLVGPRQVGKTTLLLEIAKEFGSGALYASADAPEASLPGWGDRVWRQAREKASGGAAILLLDEVQQFPDWSRWLKGHFDAIRREELPLRVVASGSSSLRIGAGARESMAGRFERHELMQWNAGDLAARFGLSDAARRFITQGGYPGATRFWDEPERWRDYIHHAIVDPIIGRDILQLEQVRKPALLRQVFAMAAGHPAEILSLEKIAGTLAEKGSLETIAHYLELLREAYLVTPLQKFAAGEMRRRRSPPKLVVMDNALLGREGADPNSLRDPTRWGRWVENACLAEALRRGLDVSYWRQEPWEVDAVIQGGEGDWLVEIKTGAFGHSDLRGLAMASQRFPTLRPLVLCDAGREAPAQDAGFHVQAWEDFLMGNGLGETSPRT